MRRVNSFWRIFQNNVTAARFCGESLRFMPHGVRQR
jgi:hypothetical protein